MRKENVEQFVGRRLLTDLEAAPILSCKVGTLRKWRSQGGGPKYIKIGALCRYRLQDLEDFIEQQIVAR
ncbi:MAG: hypothetical protein BWK76_28220 [Desulfobulbaceae bacterium A2]|nr:MAG: hypothetical protein BWK76_28220 [Desulfobulbaceae bacterium A2]